MRMLRFAAIAVAIALVSCSPSTSASHGALPVAMSHMSVPQNAMVDAGVDPRGIVAIEYEAWFGPNAVPFTDAEAQPILQSADMRAHGGGYDSADPAVIAQHVRWLEYMGVDAATIDLTNNVGCIFSSGTVSARFCQPATEAFRRQNRSIRDNTGNLYPAWTALGTNLKLIPLLGCQTYRDLVAGSDGRSGFQNEVDYFGALIARYPSRAVEYLGHPLLLVYLGTPVDTTIYERARAMLQATGLDQKYTFRFVGGYLDSQPTFWKNPAQQGAPEQIAPHFNFWSVVDRYKPSSNLYPTYSVRPDAPAQIENLTASIAVAGQNGWGCPEPTYCADDALRYGSDGTTYQALQSFMTLAATLKPQFLIVDQFNEFSRPDEGWNPNTSDDTEPTQLPAGWGYSGIAAVRDAIAAYRLSR